MLQGPRNKAPLRSTPFPDGHRPPPSTVSSRQGRAYREMGAVLYRIRLVTSRAMHIIRSSFCLVGGLGGAPASKTSQFQIPISQDRVHSEPNRSTGLAPLNRLKRQQNLFSHLFSRMRTSIVIFHGCISLIRQSLDGLYGRTLSTAANFNVEANRAQLSLLKHPLRMVPVPLLSALIYLIAGLTTRPLKCLPVGYNPSLHNICKFGWLSVAFLIVDKTTWGC